MTTKTQQQESQPSPPVRRTSIRALKLLAGGAAIVGLVVFAAVLLPTLAGRGQALVGTTGGDVNALPQGPKIGYRAPDFTLTDLAGKTVSLHELQGKPVMVYFWALWCPYCGETMPRVEQTYRESNGAFEVLAISLPVNKQDLVQWMERNHKEFSFPIFIDTGSTTVEYEVPYTTTAFFIDKTGVIRAWHNGLSGPISEEKLREYLKTIL